jgi:hypothetical protein
VELVRFLLLSVILNEVLQLGHLCWAQVGELDSAASHRCFCDSKGGGRGEIVNGLYGDIFYGKIVTAGVDPQLKNLFRFVAFGHIPKGKAAFADVQDLTCTDRILGAFHKSRRCHFVPLGFSSLWGILGRQCLILSSRVRSIMLREVVPRFTPVLYPDPHSQCS